VVRRVPSLNTPVSFACANHADVTVHLSRASGFECVPPDMSRRFHYSQRSAANEDHPTTMSPSQLSQPSASSLTNSTTDNTAEQSQGVSLHAAFRLPDPAQDTLAPATDLSEFISSLFQPSYPAGATGFSNNEATGASLYPGLLAQEPATSDLTRQSLPDTFDPGLLFIPPDDFDLPGGWDTVGLSQTAQIPMSFPSPGVLDSLLNSARDHDADIYAACLLRHAEERKALHQETASLDKAGESVSWAEVDGRCESSFSLYRGQRSAAHAADCEYQSWFPSHLRSLVAQCFGEALTVQVPGARHTAKTRKSLPSPLLPLSSTPLGRRREPRCSRRLGSEWARAGRIMAWEMSTLISRCPFWATLPDFPWQRPSTLSGIFVSPLPLIRHISCVLIPTETYNFMIGGAAASYAALLVGEAVVRGVMGSQPQLDLSDALRKCDMGLVCFSQADLGHCLSTKGRKPMYVLGASVVTCARVRLGQANRHRFNLSGNGVNDALQAFPETVDGVPYTVPLLLHEILHEVVSGATVNGEQFAGLEHRIRALFNQSSVPLIWSRAGLLVLYQRLRGAGALHPVVKAMAWDILLNLEPKPCLKAQVFPLFLAGTVSFLQTQRDAIRSRWVKAPEKGFEESFQFLQALWNEMDETGQTVDWLSFGESRKATLAFF
jgi:hypothetical protein